MPVNGGSKNTTRYYSPYGGEGEVTEVSRKLPAVDLMKFSPNCRANGLKEARRIFCQSFLDTLLRA